MVLHNHIGLMPGDFEKGRQSCHELEKRSGYIQKPDRIPDNLKVCRSVIACNISAAITSYSRKKTNSQLNNRSKTPLDPYDTRIPVPRPVIALPVKPYTTKF
ncbi:MAG: hypothetical protein CVV34_00255 [Methanomicrobiales archaeon HGW-Methanomicrobiales-5]|nr:MAG: hypothetical protein CVV34_00255 [Methanomicrobiales archaeon HGW-Methanomicrobiales-5]